MFKKLVSVWLLLVCTSVTATVQPRKQYTPPIRRLAPIPSSIVYDVDAKKNVYEVNSSGIVSIASMTKMITVLTVLEANQDLNETITIIGKESSPRIRKGQRMSRSDVIELALVASDNLAAHTLIENYPTGYSNGVRAMNELAQQLGAVSTVIVEPTGLMADNKSTVNDMTKIAQAAGTYSIFGRFANMPQAQVQVENVSKTKRILRWIAGTSTNPFVMQPVNFQMLAVKTGFTSAAGWCITMLVSYNNHRYVLVTTGNLSKQARKMQADNLIQRMITNQQSQVEIADSNFYIKA
jgi:D-alanyl-D-alanine carboxypeptidase